MYPGLDSKDSDLISLVKEKTRKALADKTSTTTDDHFHGFIISVKEWG